MTALILLLWLIYLLLLLAPLALERIVLRRKLDWFSPLLFDIFVALIEVGRPAFIALRDWETVWIVGNENSVQNLLTRVLLYWIIGRLTLLVSYYMGPRRIGSAGFRTPRFPLSMHKLWALVLVAGTGGVFVYLRTIGHVGGLLSYLSESYRRRWLLSGNFYLLTPILIFFPAMIWLVCGTALARRRHMVSGTFGLVRSNIALLACVAVCVFCMLTLGERGAAARFVLGLIAVSHYCYRRWKPTTLAAAVCVGLILLPGLGSIRAATGAKTLEHAARDTAHGVRNESLLSLLFNKGQSVDRTMVVIDGVPEQVPFQYGATYLRIFAAAIPRQLWPEKPGLTEASVYAGLFGQETDGAWGSYPAGSIGDYYLQGGIVGIILLSTLSGLLRRAAYEQLIVRSGGSPVIVTLYVAALTTQVFELRNLMIVWYLLHIAAVALGVCVARATMPHRVRRTGIAPRLLHVKVAD